MAGGMFKNPAGVISGKAASAGVTEYTFGRLTTNTTAADAEIETSASGEVIGVITETGTAGQITGIATSGIGYLKVDGSGTAITVNDFLKPTTAGVGIKAATNLDRYGAIALEPSTAAGDVIKVLIVNGILGAA